MRSIIILIVLAVVCLPTISWGQYWVTNYPIFDRPIFQQPTMMRPNFMRPGGINPYLWPWVVNVPPQPIPMEPVVTRVVVRPPPPTNYAPYGSSQGSAFVGTTVFVYSRPLPPVNRVARSWVVAPAPVLNVGRGDRGLDSANSSPYLRTRLSPR